MVGGGGERGGSIRSPLAKISDNDAIHLKLGALILLYKRNKMVQKKVSKWLPFSDDGIKNMANRDFL